MTLDLACLVIVVLAAVRGAFGGAARQLSRLAAIAVGWLGARWASPALAPLLQGSVPAFAAHPIASVLAFVGFTVLALLLARGLLAFTALGRVRGTGGDRGLGALLGAAQAALVLWVVLSALAVWNRPLRVGRFAIDPAGSDLVALAREHGALGTFKRVLSPDKPADGAR